MVPRILVGGPTTSQKEYVLEEYLSALLAIDYPSFDILIVDNSEDPTYADRIRRPGVEVLTSPRHENPYDRLVAARELLRRRAIDEGYDYYCSIESDILVPPDLLTRLLAHGKEYVTTVVYNVARLGQQPFIVVRVDAGDGKTRDLTQEEIDSSPLVPIARSHLGCTLISTRLLREVTFRHDGWQYDDYLLCDDLRAKKVELWCDTRILIKHFPDGSLHREAREWRRKTEG